MTMRKLNDPILNDLMLMVQGRKASNLSSQAITRYVQHIDRLDAELEDARSRTGKPRQAYGDDVEVVTTTELGQLRAAAGALATVVADAEALRATADAATRELAEFSATLLTRFSPRLMKIQATTAPDAALQLLAVLDQEAQDLAAQLAALQASAQAAAAANVPPSTPQPPKGKR